MNFAGDSRDLDAGCFCEVAYIWDVALDLFV